MKDEWQPIETSPKDGKAVLIWYKNSFDNGRTIKAFYAEKYKIESDGDCDLDLDYFEQNDQYFLPVGWYEIIENWGDFSYIAVSEGSPSHWMSLPAPPKDSND